MKRYIKSYTNNYHGGAEWCEADHDIFMDGKSQKFTAYTRDIDDMYSVSIIPFYNEKSDFFGYKVLLEYKDLNTSPKKIEVFETFYDAMDFVDSGEMADLYL